MSRLESVKVLHVIPSISSLRGGPSVAVLEMAAAQRQLGMDVAILTTNDDGPRINSSMPLGQWFQFNGVPVIAFPRWSPPLAVIREFSISTGLNYWLAMHIGDYQLLHIHALFSWVSTTSMAMARRAKVPYVISTIGQLNHWSLGQSAGRKRVFLRLIERRNLNGAAALHFTTDDERDQALSLGLLAPSWVIPLGVHLPTSSNLSLSESKKTTTFLFLSRIHPKKQLERLIEALALLKRRRSEADWQLCIAGDGDPDYLRSLQRLIASSGIADRCRWLGFVEGQAKWDVLQQADWFILPSASENFGIAAIEALAAGTPPILSADVAVSTDIAAEAAGIIASSEPHALAQVLEASLGGPSAEMQAAARRLASSRYSWPSIAALFHQAYSSVLP